MWWEDKIMRTFRVRLVQTPGVLAGVRCVVRAAQGVECLCQFFPGQDGLGSQPQRLTEAVSGLFRPALTQENHAQVVMRCTVIGAKLDEPLKGDFGVVQTAVVEQELTQGVDGLGPARRSAAR